MKPNTKAASQLDFSRLQQLSEKQKTHLFMRLHCMGENPGDSNRRYAARRKEETGEDSVARAHWLITLMAQLVNQAGDHDDEIQLSTYGLQALFETVDDLLSRRFDDEPAPQSATQEAA